MSEAKDLGEPVERLEHRSDLRAIEIGRAVAKPVPPAAGCGCGFCHHESLACGCFRARCVRWPGWPVAYYEPAYITFHIAPDVPGAAVRIIGGRARVFARNLKKEGK